MIANRRPLAAVVTALAGLLAVTGCGGSPGGAAGGVQTLAKVDGHRAEMAMPPNTFAVLEVAYDADTAQRMWQDNVPADLPTQDGEPRDAGRYGDLSDVDFSREAVAVWSSGESGSCPARVSDVELDSGYLVVTEDDDSDIGGACTADYNSYRVLVVVDRADLPEPDALATTGVRIKDTSIGSQVLLSLYPVS